jgi:hypothetical protein
LEERVGPARGPTAINQGFSLMPTFKGSRETLADRLSSAGLNPEWFELGNGVWQAVFPEGDSLNWSSTKGTIWCQGKPELKQARERQIAEILGTDFATAAPKVKAVGAVPSRKVFVVYGHDEKTRNELEAMLRRWELDPIILDQLTANGQTS